MHASMVPWVVLFLLLNVVACAPSVPQNQAELESIFEAASRESKRIAGYDPRFENPYIEVFVRREIGICDWNRKWVSLTGSLDALKGSKSDLGKRLEATSTPWRGKVAGAGVTNEGDLVIRVEIGKRYPIVLMQRMALEEARSSQWTNHDESVLESMRSLRVGQTVFFFGEMMGERQRYPWRFSLVGGDCNINRVPKELQRDLEEPVVYFRFRTITADSESARR
jgi:hypothetical protein